jgi:Domain of unknown function (DUF1707)
MLVTRSCSPAGPARREPYAGREVPVVMNPQDPGAGWAPDGGHLRVSDEDRERMVGFLKTAFVQGRLSRDELAGRAGQALEARTRAQLAAVTAGIPAGPAARPECLAGPTAAAQPRQSAPAPARTRAWPVSRKAIAWALSMIIVLPGLGVAFVATYYGGIIILLLLGFTAAVLLEMCCPSEAGWR